MRAPTEEHVAERLPALASALLATSASSPRGVEGRAPGARSAPDLAGCEAFVTGLLLDNARPRSHCRRTTCDKAPSSDSAAVTEVCVATEQAPHTGSDALSVPVDVRQVRKALQEQRS